MKEKLSNDSTVDIKANLLALRERISETALSVGRNPDDIRLMAVTKTISAQKVNEAIAAGITLIGENRAQELLEKYDDYHKNGLEIHFIGSLQSNKVKYIIDKVDMIHSVDRVSLAEEINKQAQSIGKVMDVLIQVNSAKEDTKSGVFIEDVPFLMQKIQELSNLRLRGLMAIPPETEEYSQQLKYFCEMRALLVDIQAKNCDNGSIDVLSIGMSSDYPAAIAQESTILRLGSAIFGTRQ